MSVFRPVFLPERTGNDERILLPSSECKESDQQCGYHLYAGCDRIQDGYEHAEADGLDTKIYAYDHNYDYSNLEAEKQYPVKIYGDSDASQYIAGAAYHNYGGDREELLEIHKKRLTRILDVAVLNGDEVVILGAERSRISRKWWRVLPKK